MKIKDCLACKMKEEDVVGFVTDVIPLLIAYGSWGDALDGWYEDAETDPEEASFSKDFLVHMTTDHYKEIDGLCNTVCVKIHKLAQEVF